MSLSFFRLVVLLIFSCQLFRCVNKHESATRKWFCIYLNGTTVNNHKVNYIFKHKYWCISLFWVFSCVHGAIGCGQKCCTQVWRCHSSCSGSYPRATCSECHVSKVGRLMIWVIMIWYKGLCISWLRYYGWENPPKTSARRSSMKGMRPVIASNGVPYIQMSSVGSGYNSAYISYHLSFPWEHKV